MAHREMHRTVHNVLFSRRGRARVHNRASRIRRMPNPVVKVCRPVRVSRRRQIVRQVVRGCRLDREERKVRWAVYPATRWGHPVNSLMLAVHLVT